MDDAEIQGVPQETSLIRGPPRQNSVTLMSWLVVANLLYSSKLFSTESLDKTLEQLGRQGKALKEHVLFNADEHDTAVDREVEKQATNIRNWFFHRAQEEHPATEVFQGGGDPPPLEPAGPFYDRFGEHSPERQGRPPSPARLPRGRVMLSVIANPDLRNGARGNVTMALFDEDLFYSKQGPGTALVVGCRPITSQSETFQTVTPAGMWFHLRVHKDLGASGGPVELGNVDQLLARICETVDSFYGLVDTPEGWDDMVINILRNGQTRAVQYEQLIRVIVTGPPDTDYAISAREDFLFYTILPESDGETEFRDEWPPSAKRPRDEEDDQDKSQDQSTPAPGSGNAETTLKDRTGTTH